MHRREIPVQITNVAAFDEINDSDIESDNDSLFEAEFNWKDDLKWHFRNFKRSQLQICVFVGSLIICITLLLRNDGSSKIFKHSDFSNREKCDLDRIILPWSSNAIETNSTSVQPIQSDLFDFRLSSALLLISIMYELENGKLLYDFKIPFSWQDFKDKYDYEENDKFLINWLTEHPQFENEIHSLRNPNCKTFCLLYGCEALKEWDSVCVDNKDSNRFKLKRAILGRIKEDGRRIISENYSKSMPPPNRVYLMNTDKEMDVIIKVDETIDNSHSNSYLRNEGVTKELLNWWCDKRGIENFDALVKSGLFLDDIRNEFSKLIHSSKADIELSSNDQIKYENSRILLKNSKEINIWEAKDFYWEEEEFLNTLFDKYLDDNKSLDGNLWTNIDNMEHFKTKFGYAPKYFYEADLYQTAFGSHYDWRFFKTSLTLNNQKKSVIHRLARTWARFCDSAGLKSFTAYGSLLGWIRNGLTLPWDSDLDVIVTMDTLHRLAREFNQTLIFDFSVADGFQSGMSGYLLDINPNFYSREKDGGFNSIDGRLIDISTGMYLDISALTWTKNYLSNFNFNDEFLFDNTLIATGEHIPNTDFKIFKTMQILVDENYQKHTYTSQEDFDIYQETILQEIEILQSRRQLVHCKNDNVYSVAELRQMIPTFYEGVKTWLPKEYHKIIMRLYPSALGRYTEPGHMYDAKRRLWIPFDENRNPQTQFDVNRELEIVGNYTKLHLKWMENPSDVDLSGEWGPLRIDDFFQDYAEWIGKESQILDWYKQLQGK